MALKEVQRPLEFLFHCDKHHYHKHHKFYIIFTVLVHNAITNTWGRKYIWLNITQSPALSTDIKLFYWVTQTCVIPLPLDWSALFFFMDIYWSIRNHFLLLDNRTILSRRKKEICSLYIAPLLLHLLNIPACEVVLGVFEYLSFPWKFMIYGHFIAFKI